MEAKKNLAVIFLCWSWRNWFAKKRKNLNNLWKEERIIGLKLFYYVNPSNKRLYKSYKGIWTKKTELQDVVGWGSLTSIKQSLPVELFRFEWAIFIRQLCWVIKYQYWVNGSLNSLWKKYTISNFWQRVSVSLSFIFFDEQ